MWSYVMTHSILQRWLAGLLLASLFLMATPALAQDAAEYRIVENPYFVTFLKDDGSLEYYEVIDSKGFYVGFTFPGWRNDRLGRQVVDVARRGDGARAELWHLSGDIYYVDFYRANGSFIGSGSFSAAGIEGGQGNFVGNTGTTGSTTTNAASTTVITTTQVTTTGNTPVNVNTGIRVGDRGTSDKATGTFDGTYYIVARGDNLFRIALRFNTTLAALQSANNITNPSRIEVGQRIRIP